MSDNLDEILGVASSAPPAQAGSPNVNSPYYGWGGWLALFCIVQIFVQPILVVVAVASDASAFGYNSSLDAFAAIEIFGTIGLGVFGIIVGISLWRLRPGAVGIAKTYLVTALVWSVFKAIVAFAMLEGRFQETVGPQEVLGVFTTLIPFAIWFSYFNVSKRIKATFFGEEDVVHIIPPGN